MLRKILLVGVVGLFLSPCARAGDVVESLKPYLIDHYSFDNPRDGDIKSSVELDLGSDKTDINLLNGAPRAEDGAFPGSKYCLQTGQKNEQPNDDWKAGVMFKNSAESTLKGSQHATGATIMGWFKPLGTAADNPSNNTNPGQTGKYNAFGLGGLLRGDEGVNALDGHAVRALLEVIGGKVAGLGRRLDSQMGSGQCASADNWDVVMPPNQWTHLAATFDFENGKIVLYKNGQPLNTGPANVASWQNKPGEKNYTSNTAAGGIKIGGSFPDNSVERNPFNGRIDELMFFNKSLTAEEIAAQYKLFGVSAPAASPAAR